MHLRGHEALRQMEPLDPVVDCHAITRLSYLYEFPFDHARATEIALLRTFAVPRVSHILQRSGELVRRTQRRVDDTDLLLSVLVERGYDHPEGRTVLQKMKRMHGRFAIENDLYLYVLSTFVMEPLRYNARFGHRPLTAKERLALFHFWREVGRRMGIEELPTDLDEMERFNREFEAREMYYEPGNHQLCEDVLASLLSRVPPAVRPVYRTLMVSMMDAPLREALGYPAPPRSVASAVHTGLRLLGRLGALIPHRTPVPVHDTTRRSYPEGFELTDVGADVLWDREA